MTDSEERKNWFQRRNWWKIGFFVLLIAFEFVREIAVLATNTPPEISGNAIVGQQGPFVIASGRWAGLNKDEDLVPSSISIECDQQSGECVEASVMVLDGRVGTPHVERFPAKFEPDAVSYQNERPLCVSYFVRIDLKLKKVIAVQQPKDTTDSELCKGTEQRIEMTLGNGWRTNDELFKDHFVPILSALAATVRFIDG